MRDIEVRRNSGLSGKARSTLHALHAPLVRCACPFIEATHIEHYRNTYSLVDIQFVLAVPFSEVEGLLEFVHMLYIQLFEYRKDLEP